MLSQQSGQYGIFQITVRTAGHPHLDLLSVFQDSDKLGLFTSHVISAIRGHFKQLVVLQIKQHKSRCSVAVVWLLASSG